MKRLYASIFIGIVFVVFGISAENAGDVRLCWEAGVGTRAFSMANNATAAVNDLSSLYWNPAALAFMPVREFQLGLDGVILQGRYSLAGSEGSSDPLIRPRISHAGVAFAVPTSRGGLSFAAAFQNIALFDDVSSYQLDSTYHGFPWIVQDMYRAFGGLRLWSGGGGIQIAPGVAAGGALSLLTGQEEGSSEFLALSGGVPYQEESIHFSKRYVGFDGRIGILIQAGEALRMGARVGFPRRVRFTVAEETADQVESFDGTLYSSFTGAMGFTLALPFLTTSLEIGGRAPYTMALPAENIPKSSSARYTKTEAGIGIEVPLIITPIAVRAGYRWAEIDLHPYIVRYRDNAIGWSDGGFRPNGSRHLFSLGIGYVSGHFSLEAAYGANLWRLVIPGLLDDIDLFQSYLHHRIASSVSIRF